MIPSAIIVWVYTVYLIDEWNRISFTVWNMNWGNMCCTKFYCSCMSTVYNWQFLVCNLADINFWQNFRIRNSINYLADNSKNTRKVSRIAAAMAHELFSPIAANDWNLSIYAGFQPKLREFLLPSINIFDCKQAFTLYCTLSYTSN